MKRLNHSSLSNTTSIHQRLFCCSHSHRIPRSTPSPLSNFHPLLSSSVASHHIKKLVVFRPLLSQLHHLSHSVMLSPCTVDPLRYRDLSLGECLPTSLQTASQNEKEKYSATLCKVTIRKCIQDAVSDPVKQTSHASM